MITEKFKRDNRGIALVSVMVLLTVCMLMATVIVEITYSSMLSRRINTRADNNFYSAESAVDDLEAVVQSLAVQAVLDLETPAYSSLSFVDAAESRVITAAKGSGYTITSTKFVNFSEAEFESLSKYMFDQLDYDIKKVLGKPKLNDDGSVATDAEGHIIYEYDATKFNVHAAKVTQGTATQKGTLTFSVDLSYENPETGYLTNISTDLVMHDVTHRTPASAYPVGSYSMFTGGGAGFSGNDQLGNGCLSIFFQEGNTYYGTQDGSTTSCEVSDCSLILNGDRVIINGDVYLKNNAAMIFTGRKVKDGVTIFPEIDIRGTVYIDSSSVLVLNEGCDFMCKDIVFTSSGESFWNTTSDFSDKYGTFGSFYPYTYDNREALKTGGNTTGHMDGNFLNGKTAGCVMYRTESASYVLTCAGYNNSTDSYKYALNGAENGLSSTKINKSGNFIPTAKKTVWAYDGKALSVDAELANFANINLMYYKSKESNQITQKDNIRLLNYLKQKTNAEGVVTQDTIMKTEQVDTGKGGAPLTIHTFETVSTTDATKNKTYKTSDSTIYKTKIKAQTGSTGIIANSTLLDGDVKFDIMSQSDSQLVNPSENSVTIYSLYNYYYMNINQATSTLGIFISEDKVDFNALGKGSCTCYSLLSVKEDDPSAYDTVAEVVNALKYSSNIGEQTISGFASASGYYNNDINYYEQAYAIASINSNFLAGIESLLDEGETEVNNGGAVSMDVKSMYDFVSVQNWSQN